MTQQQLAQAVGIRFQQIKKYESGANRISVSRLWDLARALDMPISFFFEGLGAGKDGQGATDDGLLRPVTMGPRASGASPARNWSPKRQRATLG